MSSIEQKVTEQWDKFLAELPTLLRTIPDKWVVYCDGVRLVVDDERQAREFGVRYYSDIDAGYVIAKVVEQKPIHVSQLGSAGVAIVAEHYDELKAKHVALVEESNRLRTENAALRAVADAAFRLIGKLPQCEYCIKPATRFCDRRCDSFCDDCGTDIRERSYAQSLRDLVAALRVLEAKQ